MQVFQTWYSSCAAGTNEIPTRYNSTAIVAGGVELAKLGSCNRRGRGGEGGNNPLNQPSLHKKLEEGECARSMHTTLINSLSK